MDVVYDDMKSMHQTTARGLLATAAFAPAGPSLFQEHINGAGLNSYSLWYELPLLSMLGIGNAITVSCVYSDGLGVLETLIPWEFTCGTTIFS